MSAAVAPETPDLEAALAAARQRLEEARARETEVVSKLEAAAAALGRGSQAHDAACAEFERLESAENEWIEREAKRLQAVYAAGHQTPPALVADPKAQQARTSALVNVRARAAALEQLAVDEQAVREELVAVQREVAAADDGVRRVEREVLAVKVLHHLGEGLRVGEMLRSLQPPDDLNSVVSPFGQEPVPVSERERLAVQMLGRLEAHSEQEQLHMTLPELRAIQYGGRAPSILAKRLAEVIAAGALTPAAEQREEHAA
jgi:hypothetical protein